MHARAQESLTRPVQFFTGKGGVGKSTVLGALATAAARAAKRPLIVELGMHTASSRLFHGPDVGYEPTEVAMGVHATRVLFEPALVDYVTARLKIRPIALLVARNDSLRRLFMAAPGVDEIVTLHRVAQLAAGGCWDPILVDLESTGHALMFFDLPSVLEVFLKDGPLRQVVDSATDLVRDGRRCAVHIVTVPEPLAVNETVQLYRDLRRRGDLHLGCLFINRIPQLWLDDDEQRLVRTELAGDSAGQPWASGLKVAEYLTRRRQTADKCLRGLRRAIDLPTMMFDTHEEGSASIIESLSGVLQQAVPW
ncbi:MAG: ArsA-related P-loop ATPase [Polyangiales bacterium]